MGWGEGVGAADPVDPVDPVAQEVQADPEVPEENGATLHPLTEGATGAEAPREAKSNAETEVETPATGTLATGIQAIGIQATGTLATGTQATGTQGSGGALRAARSEAIVRLCEVAPR